MKTLAMVLGVLAMIGAAGVSFAQDAKEKPVADKGGHGVGNGGWAIVCRNPMDGSIRAAQILDYYDAKRWKLTVDLGEPKEFAPGTSDEAKREIVKAKIGIMLERLRQVSPRRAQLYAERVAAFWGGEASFSKGIVIATANRNPDHGRTTIPQGCGLELAAEQHRPVVKEDPYYEVNADIVDALSPDDYAGLVMHEIIYREALDIDREYHYFSTRARHFNAYLASGKINQLTPQELVEFLRSMKFNGVKIGDHEYSLYAEKGEWAVDRRSLEYTTVLTAPLEIDFHPNGQVRKGRLAPLQRPFVPLQGKMTEIYSPADVEFHANGNLAKGQLVAVGPDGRWTKEYTEVRVGSVIVEASEGDFDAEGNPISLKFRGTPYLPVGDQLLRFGTEMYSERGVFFYPSGSVKKGKFAVPTLYKVTGSFDILVDKAEFAEDGTLTEAEAASEKDTRASYVVWNGRAIDVKGLSLFPGGKTVSSFSVGTYDPIYVTVQRTKVQVNGTIYLYPSGKLKEVSVSEKNMYQFRRADGKLCRPIQYSRIYLDENGFVTNEAAE